MSTKGTKRRKRGDRQTNELRYTFCCVTNVKKESKKRHRRKEGRKKKESGAVVSDGRRAVKSKILFP
jgi:hypothetical protein